MLERAVHTTKMAMKKGDRKKVWKGGMRRSRYSVAAWGGLEELRRGRRQFLRSGTGEGGAWGKGPDTLLSGQDYKQVVGNDKKAKAGPFWEQGTEFDKDQ